MNALRNTLGGSAEAQVFHPVDFVFARRFDPRLDASRTSRELAIAWAEKERKDIERGGAYVVLDMPSAAAFWFWGISR